MKFLESQGVPRNKIIDGRVFQVPNLNLPRLLAEGVAYGTFESSKSFSDISVAIYQRSYKFNDNPSTMLFGVKSYIGGDSLLEGSGSVTIGNFSSLSWELGFNMMNTSDHNYHNVSVYSLGHLDWFVPLEFISLLGDCQINIGNDVWIGRGCKLKCSNPNKPLVIGDGAVIAADSVVVKNVPPYAIVGGNPAQIIKYRFPPDVIEAFLRIKWWNWSIDKIHDNFQYFNDVEKFISMHDK